MVRKETKDATFGGRLNARQAATLDAFLYCTLRILPVHYRPDCCVAAARIGKDVFGRLGVPCRALAAMCVIQNGPMAALCDSFGRYPETEEEAERWVGLFGAWQVDLGRRIVEPDNPVGHVVLVLWEKIMVDLTLPQANRPSKGIDLHAIASLVSPRWLTGEVAEQWHVNGCRVVYQAEPDYLDWQRSADWQRRGRCEEHVKRIVEGIKLRVV